MSYEREAVATAVAELPARLAAVLDLEPASIGAEDNLIELGLDSIALMRLAGAWRKAGLDIAFADLASTPTLAAWQSLLEATIPAVHAVAGPPVDALAPFELALMQHAYWVGRADGQQLGGVAAHFYDEFDGRAVDPDRLEQAVRQVLARHGMLRVRVLDDGRQQILPESPWSGLRVHDLREVADVDGALAELRTTLSHRSLDITSGEVFDVQLSLLPDDATRVHVNLDMVAADALSLRVLLADLARFYQGETVEPITYSYPQYQADRRQDESVAARNYWQERLATLPAAPQLPVRSDVSDATKVLRRHRWLDPESLRQLEILSRKHTLTPAMSLAAVFAETLTAWSAEPDFVLNLPLFDREPVHAEVGQLVGDFTSSVLLAWDGATPGTFGERAARLQERFHADAAHTSYSGVEVLRDLSRTKGERVLAPVVYTSALGLGELFPAEVRECFGEASWIISQGPQVWLDAQVTELNGGLLVNWDAREDAFAPGVLDAMFEAYSALLDRLLAGPEAWAAPVAALLPTRQSDVRTRVNDTTAPAITDRLHDGFFRNAAANPTAPALLWGDGQMTYGELAAQALSVAGYLVAEGIKKNELVAVSLPKGPEQAVAVLGVLAAGAAYLPIGVDQPVLRRDRICKAAGVRLVLDGPVSGQPLTEPRDGDELAYVIYTSGSTGEPKGVELTHAAAMNTIADLNQRFGLTSGDRTLAVSALDFDLSVFDLFGALSAGGAVVFPREHERRDAIAWVDLILRHEVTVLNCVPALLDMTLTAAEGTPLPLKLVLLGGDWVTIDLPDRLHAVAPDARFVGLGGTTETAIHSTVLEVDEVPAHWTSVPYGVPLSNVACRVVDALGRDCPDWVPGELWIGGSGVARGYRGDPERTADRFVTIDGRRWYRTGDRARYWTDGTLEFLGRADHQVKVRGHRIELGEIESALTAFPSVDQGIASALGPRILGAAVTGSPNLVELKAFLADRLPAAMIPDRIAVLPKLPLTPNGKIDRPAVRAALLAFDHGDEVVSPPAGPVETAVAAAWSDLLDIAGIGREQDFFAIGGDSLLATRLVGKLRAVGLEGVTLSALFAHPVLADFAATLRFGQARTEHALVADPASRYEPFPPTDVQRAYWLGRGEGFTLGGIGCHFYREYDVVDLDIARLEAAVHQLVRRHEMLRAVFDAQGNQRVLPKVPAFKVEVLDTTVEGLREAASHQVFDPAEWPLFSIKVAGNRLAVGMDNLVLDALSILRFYTELSELYEDPLAELEPVGMTFRDYVVGAPPEPAALEAAQAYWADRVEDLPPAPRLPLRIDPAEVTTPRFTRRETVVDAKRWRAITERAREHGLTPSGVLLAAFAEVLGRWSTSRDLTLNLTLFDRREVHPDVGRVMGDFTSLLLVGHRPEPGESWLATARRTQGELWAALDHREVSAVQVQRDIGRKTGDTGFTIPVVFTSALGVSGGELAAPGAPFTDQVWGVSQTPQVWLDHQVTEVAGGISLNWDAVEELFPDGLLDAMFAAYGELLDWLSETDWTGATPDLLPASQRAVRTQVNATGGHLEESLLHKAFFDHARSNPDAVAITWDDGQLTYGDLAAKALTVAGALDIEPGEPVAVTLPKGPDQVIAVLGVLAAGGTYVPIGIDQPAARQERIHRLAGVRTILDHLPTGAPLEQPVDVDPAQLAYIIFTSGSTGEPKGVEITHRAALNTVADINDRYDVGPADRILAVSALDFDLSVYDIFGPLSVGAGLVTIEEDGRRDARRWFDLVSRHSVTIWNSVPALLDMLLVVADANSARLRVVLVSGDWVGLDLPGRLHAFWPDCRFIAMGGATEASIWSNAYEVREVDAAWPSIPYGYPLRNQAFRVVGPDGRDCPDWVAGELWIGGAGVAEGYRGAPEQTSKQFVAVGNGRWYRTGDLGRYWPDGTLEFLGRVDQQVKIRGHRIELGEIEAALVDHPAVGSAVVTVAGTGSARRLAAAVVPAVAPALAAGGVEASGQTEAWRSQARELEARAVEDVLVQMLDLQQGVSATAIEEFQPVLCIWLNWLVSRKVLVFADGVYSEGPELSANEVTLAVGGYAGLIGRAHRRLLERLDDYRGILAGRVDASTLLDDDILAPSNLAAADQGAEAFLDYLTNELNRSHVIAELDGDGRTAASLAAKGYDVTHVQTDGRVPADLLHKFDAVVVANALHRYPDHSQGPALASLLVKPGGRLLGLERVELTPVAMLTAALLDRGRTAMLAGAGWIDRLAEAGWTDARHESIEDSFLVTLAATKPLKAVGLDGLTRHVAERLPAHMVPEVVEVLPWLPLSANGKVDRSAVAALWADEPGPDTAFDEPVGELEQTIAALWCELLGTTSFGRQQSFFDHGGDSLQATRFIENARQRLGVELPLREMFTARTLAAVAAAFAELLGDDTEEGVL